MHKALSRKEIFSAINMSGDTRSFKRHIDPLLLANLVEMTVPDKPNSRIQKYKLTDSGRECCPSSITKFEKREEC